MTKKEAYAIIELLADNPVNHAKVIQGIMEMIDEPVRETKKAPKTYIKGTSKTAKKRKCCICGSSFVPASNSQKYCEGCRGLTRAMRKEMQKYSSDVISAASELAKM